MSTINILIAVDGEKLSQKATNNPSPNSPISLGSYNSSDVYISMVTQNNNVDNNTQGDSELQVSALSGDTMSWAITTFNNNVDYSVYLYDGTFNVVNDPDPSQGQAISDLSYSRSQQYVYLPDDTPTDPPAKLINNTYTASARLERVGVQIQYTLSFALVNNHTGDIIGYFIWDPFINVQ